MTRRRRLEINRPLPVLDVIASETALTDAYPEEPMPTTITCEGCGRQLLIGWAPNPELTCPHCMARFRNPHYQQAPPAPEQRVVPAIPPTKHCLTCDAPLESGWRFCPHCRSLNGRSQKTTPEYDSLDRDIRRDSTGTVVGLCFLGLLVVIGVITFSSAPGAGLLSGTETGVTILIAFVVLAAGLACLLVAGRSTTAKAVLSTLGMVVIAGLLVVFTVCAGILNFFESCKLHR